MDIDKFQKLIEETYLKKDAKRGLSKTFMWFTEEVGELSRALRGNNKEDLKKEYKTFLNLMAAVRTKDTATLMNDMKQIFSTGGTQYLSYMALRYDVKDEIRDYRKSTTHRNKAAGALKELRAIGLGKETVTQKDIEKILSKWNEATNAIYEDVKDAFENGMKALIRSTSTMLTLVIYLHKIYKEEEKDKLPKEGMNIQRYKGLGEMNPEQLWETTMNPANRVLRKVVVEDAAEADRLFDILLGEEVEPRKNFIQSRAQFVKNLDI